MSKIILIVCGLFVFTVAPALARRQESKRPDYVPGEILVRYKPGTTSAQIRKTRESIRAQRIQKFEINQVQHYKLPKGTSVDKAVKKLENSPNVLYAQPNYIYEVGSLPNDPGFSSLYGLHNRGQTGGTKDADIDAPEAWDTITDADPSVIVAVIDTGVDYNHKDLRDNIWTNEGETGTDKFGRDKKTNGLDDDGNGFVDDVYGWDFVNEDKDPKDDSYHGTFVSGIIAATGNNALGFAGVAWNAKIMALKAGNKIGIFTSSQEIRAIEYATKMGAKIINASWNGINFDQATLEAISAFHNQGGLFVAIAGNGVNLGVAKIKTGINIDKISIIDQISIFPAAYNLPNIIAVAATDHKDLLGEFSNYGATHVDLGAPGVLVWSTFPGNRYGRRAHGTSYAAPHVAGAAALVWSQYPNLTNLEVKERLLWSTDPLSSLQGKTVTGGRLNLANALRNDAVPPNPVSDLQVTKTMLYSAYLKWTAPDDEGQKARAYQLRGSDSPITEETWGNATLIPGSPFPKNPSELEEFEVKRLSPGTTYYFALKLIDSVGHVSALSNVITVSTPPENVLFSEDFEYLLDTTEIPGWSTNGSDGHGGPTLWHFQDTAGAFSYMTTTGHYDTGSRNYGELISPLIDLTGKTLATLILGHRLQVEDRSPYDDASIWVSEDDGGIWEKIYSSSLSHSLGELALLTLGVPLDKLVLDLSKYDGKTIRIKFFFDTGDVFFNNSSGWLIDDVVVTTED